MQAYIERAPWTGEVVGAYWAPRVAGAVVASSAEAFLNVNGRAKVFLWREKENVTVVRGQYRRTYTRIRVGTEMEEIEAGKTLDPAIRAKLEAAIIEAMQHDQQATITRATRNNGTRDEWGNLISDEE